MTNRCTSCVYIGLALLFLGCGHAARKQVYKISTPVWTAFVAMQRDSACSSLVSTDESSGNIISRWPLCYPVYQFTCADMDGDGVDDILAGVVKTTRFDTVLRKRIFVFKLVDGYIRPMWLGSRMGHPVEDFGVVTAKPLNMLRTIELEQDGRYLVADYRWKGFGFSFVQYQLRNSSLEEARKLLPAKTYNDETH